MAGFVQVLFVITCILLILIVLLQKGRGGGLGGAFGGAGAGSAFGTRTGDVLTWVTIVLTGFFLLAAMGLGPMIRPELGSVEKPVFTPDKWPEDKKDSDEIPVEISVDTGGASIHWAIDEKVTKQSPVYEGFKITVRKGQTLRAIAYRPGMKDSSETVVTYQFNPGAPESRPKPASAPASSPAPASKPAGETK